MDFRLCCQPESRGMSLSHRHRADSRGRLRDVVEAQLRRFLMPHRDRSPPATLTQDLQGSAFRPRLAPPIHLKGCSTSLPGTGNSAVGRASRGPFRPITVATVSLHNSILSEHQSRDQDYKRSLNSSTVNPASFGNPSHREGIHGVISRDGDNVDPVRHHDVSCFRVRPRIYPPFPALVLHGDG